MPSTRRQRASNDESRRSLAASVLMSTDIVRTLLPSLSFQTFVALRCTASEIRSSTQEACVELMHVLERAADLYISPNFAKALSLVSEHQPHLCWLLQARATRTPAWAPPRHRRAGSSSFLWPSRAENALAGHVVRSGPWPIPRTPLPWETSTDDWLARHADSRARCGGARAVRRGDCQRIPPAAGRYPFPHAAPANIRRDGGRGPRDRRRKPLPPSPVALTAYRAPDCRLT